jgi:serine/threonine protein kinase
MAQPIGPWTDLYAVGCMAYELCTGAVPFADSEGPMAILLRHVNEPIPPANGVNPNIDPAVSNWIAGLTAREPGRRTQTAGLALESLEDIAIALVGPRWLRDGRLNQSAPPPPAPAPAPMPSMVFETYVAPAPSRPPTGREAELPPPSAASSPRDASLEPTRDAARVDHAAISPDAFLPGRSHYRGRPPQDVPTQVPRKPPPPQRDVAPASGEPTPRVPPIVIAAALVVAIVIAAVLLLV